MFRLRLTVGTKLNLKLELKKFNPLKLSDQVVTIMLRFLIIFNKNSQPVLDLNTLGIRVFLQLFTYHLDQIGNTVRVSEFIIIPAKDFHIFPDNHR